MFLCPKELSHLQQRHYYTIVLSMTWCWQHNFCFEMSSKRGFDGQFIVCLHDHITARENEKRFISFAEKRKREIAEIRLLK